MHWLSEDVEGMSKHQRRRRAAFMEDGGAPIDRFFTDPELEQWASHWREPIDAVATFGWSLEQTVVKYGKWLAETLATLPVGQH